MESGRRKAAIAADRMRRGVIVTEQAMVTCYYDKISKFSSAVIMLNVIKILYSF